MVGEKTPINSRKLKLDKEIQTRNRAQTLLLF